MLVLTRKLQEQILIGQDITITVLRIKGNTVRIGIDAPHDVRVVRGELPRYDTPGAVAGDLPQGNRPPTGHQRPAERQDRAPDVRTSVSGLKPMVERVGQRCREARTQSVRVPTATALMD